MIPSATAMLTGRFEKAQRVRRRGEFQKVFDRGVRVHGRYVTLLMAPAPGARSRLGIVASKKLGAAVARNRAKRLIREVFRQHPPQAGRPVDVLVIPRRELFDAVYTSIEDDFRGACRRAAIRLAAATR
jgi:ribonuclease P protein component